MDVDFVMWTLETYIWRALQYDSYQASKHSALSGNFYGWCLEYGEV